MWGSDQNPYSCNYIESLLGIETNSHRTTGTTANSCNYIESLLGIETEKPYTQYQKWINVATILNPY